MILTDRELRALIEKKDGGLLTGYDVPFDWDSKDSLVQPSSVDLHVGAIFRPGVTPGKPGSAGNPKSRISLKTGETAIVETKEYINLPSGYAAFGFPPSSVSSQGLLMTNPGHIDPGFRGTLAFTVINMGREEFLLYPALPIVTILVFKLASAVGKDYASRHELDPNATKEVNLATVSKSKITQERINLLAADFVDVKKRATKQALKILTWTTLAAGLATYVVNIVENRISKIEDLRTQVIQLQDANIRLENTVQRNQIELEKEIDIERRLKIVEEQVKTKGPPATKQ
jgi:dCTP deaminase